MARRELFEETAFSPVQVQQVAYSYTFPVADQWRYLYADGVEEITELVFLAILNGDQNPTIDPNEHDQWQWCTFDQAVALLKLSENIEALRRCDRLLHDGIEVEGITSTMLAHHKTIVDRFVAACQANPHIVAAFLGGSYAGGKADAYSDLDLYLITTDAAYEPFLAEKATFIRRQFGEPLFLENWGGRAWLSLHFGGWRRGGTVDRQSK
ncbi:MAG: NUDIX domain-containing protein [Caldilineaceae bacterium]